MISLQKSFLFVHIPKTAGNSIQSVLRDYSEDQLVALRKEQDGIERFGLRNANYKIKKHSTLSEYHHDRFPLRTQPEEICDSVVDLTTGECRASEPIPAKIHLHVS